MVMSMKTDRLDKAICMKCVDEHRFFWGMANDTVWDEGFLYCVMMMVLHANCVSHKDIIEGEADCPYRLEHLMKTSEKQDG